jgi:hypothetical protein
VEKVMYLLLDGDPGIGRALRHQTVPALRASGGRRIQINVVDATIGPPFGVAPDPDDTQLTAAVSVWADTAEGSGIGTALPPAGEGGTWHGYLMKETEPRPNTTVAPRPDGRVPGFAQLVPLSVPEGLNRDAWRARWASHTPIALANQSSFRYVQNVVVRPLTADAPPYAAVMEECFRMAAATDLHVFFDAVGDDAKLARHMAAMADSCDRFMDAVAPVAWTAEYLYTDETDETDEEDPDQEDPDQDDQDQDDQDQDDQDP